MRPPYSEYAAPPIYIYPGQPKRGLRFSSTEIRQLLIAILALSGAFTVLFIRYNFVVVMSLPSILFLFGVSLLAVGTGVGLHEIMHKLVAQRYGHWAEFRYDPRGLLLAFVFAFIGFIFGAPGATYISGNVTQDQNGRISAAGPLTNITISVVFFGATVAVLGMPPTTLTAVLLSLFFEVASVNGILAAFNMLPIMPLDGAKVWAWNKPAYAGIMGLAVVLAVVGFFPQILTPLIG